MMTTEDYVTYELAVKLRKLRFDWPARAFYCQPDGDIEFHKHNSSVNFNMISGYYSAPTLDQAVKWLRMVKGILVICTPEVDDYTEPSRLTGEWICNLWRGKEDHWNPTEKTYSSYEKAALAGIEEALKL